MLTGDFATEVSDASGMQLLDVPNRCWSDELLEILDIDKSMLAKVYESCEVTGHVSDAAAALTGLSAETLVVATNCTYPPMEFLNDKKVPNGYSIAYATEVLKRAGYEMELRDVAWDGIFAGLAAGNYDLLAASTTITPERQKAFDFTEPYYGVVQAVVMPKGKKINSLADLKGLTVGSQIGITGVFVLRKADVGAKIKEYDDIGLAFEDLAAGRTDAVICDDPVAKFYANKREDFAGKFSVAYLHKDPEYYGFCLRKGETELLERLNKAIASMQADGTEAKLKIKWMGSAD